MLAALEALQNGDIENAITALTPGGIEAQERAGQLAFIANEILPIKCNFCTREQVEGMGVQFGEPIDDLFVSVQLPDGWKKVATSHSMWSELQDEKGRKRASIFYKAAFYDRDAFISLDTRFRAGSAPVCGYDSPDYDFNATPTHGAVWDQGKIVWHTKQVAEKPGPDSSREDSLTYYDLDDELKRQAVAWLTEHYPDYKDPLAYWD